jgi:UDP:flavonoid glycosyltransferase YjiC (YdhE family)
MRFLFCSLANHGMLFPFLGLAQALRGRGHEVAFVTGPSMAGLLAKAGLTRIPRNEQDGDSFRVELCGHPLEMARQVKHIEAALQRFKADVLVGQQLAFGPLIAGERQGLPVATLGLAAYLWPTEVPREPPEHRKFVLGRYEGFLKPFQLARYMFGLEARDTSYGDSPLLGDLFLLRSVPELEGGVEHLPSRVRLVGDCLWDAPEEDAALRDWLEEAASSGEAVLYAQPGRVFDVPGFWKHLCAALEGLPIRTVASVGRMEEAPEGAPANFLVRKHVPQGGVLPYVRAVISSSTTTAVLGALRHGKPLLLIPGGGGGEQKDLTWRCMRAGAAVELNPTEVTPGLLRARLQELLESEGPRRQAEGLQRALARVDGRARTVELLEQLAARPPRGGSASA